MRISEIFNLPSRDQANFEFVNLLTTTDNEFFIDPTRMRAENSYSSWGIKLDGFHQSVFELYEDGRKKEARALFTKSGESNEILLGYSRGLPGGTGNSEESLVKVYDYIEEHALYNDELIENPEDLILFIPKFGPDHLSDFIASVLKNELVDFTIEQSIKHDIPRDHDFTYSYWDELTNVWKETTKTIPQVNGRPLVLLPKEIVVRDYLISPDEYLKKVVLIWRQGEHQRNDTELHRNRSENYDYASKVSIQEEELKNRDITLKEYIIDQTRENRDLLGRERRRVQNAQMSGHSNKLSDEEWNDLFDEIQNEEE